MGEYPTMPISPCIHLLSLKPLEMSSPPQLCPFSLTGWKRLTLSFALPFLKKQQTQTCTLTAVVLPEEVHLSSQASNVKYITPSPIAFAMRPSFTLFSLAWSQVRLLAQGSNLFLTRLTGPDGSGSANKASPIIDLARRSLGMVSHKICALKTHI